MAETTRPQYASKTEVPIEKTKTEIERLLIRYGATGFSVSWLNGRQAIIFDMADRRYRFDFLLATEADIPRHDKHGKPLRLNNYPGGSLQGAIEQANRTRWRELFLGIKAKLVMVDAGITTLEEEFLAHVVLPNHQTVHQWVSPQLKQIYGSGRMPKLLPGVEEETTE